jgi:hypothetical protein
MKIILIISLSFLLLSCEDTNVIGNDLLFEEYTVIRSELKANNIFEGVSITKTLPLDEKYDIAKAEIKNAEVILKVDGVQVIPLHYTGEGLYKPLYTVRIKPGITYELFVEINGKSVYGFTRVPEVPEIEDASFFENSYITADINAKPNEVYGAVWVINPSSPIKGNNFFSIVPTTKTDSSGIISLRTDEIPEEYRSQLFRERTFIQTYAFDQQYLDYFKTKFNNLPLENSFTGSSGPVAWNVKGEKVIGLFIGLAEGELVKP